MFKVADEDGNNRLSKQEIMDLCMINLKRFVKDKGEGMIDDLCDYFTNLIFESCDVNIEDEIPLDKIKDIILRVKTIITILIHHFYYREKKILIY